MVVVSNDSFDWFDHVVSPFIFLSVVEPTPRTLSSSLLREKIREYGVNTLDRKRRSLFEFLNETKFTNKHIDIIFEFKPVMPSYQRDKSVCNYTYHNIHNYYILSKFLEQDIEFKYIRCPVRYYTNTYNNFAHFCHSNKTLYCKSFIGLLTNHYHKGITFFELMKHRLFEQNNY